MIKSQHFMSFIMASCLSAVSFNTNSHRYCIELNFHPFQFGGEWNSHLAVTLHSSDLSIQEFILWCTLTICWPRWAQKSKNICGGKSIWPFFKWFNSSPWCFMHSNCFFGTPANIQLHLSGGLGCMRACSSSCLRISSTKLIERFALNISCLNLIDFNKNVFMFNILEEGTSRARRDSIGWTESRRVQQ